MQLLLDTHILLWWFSNNPLLSKTAREIIAEPNNQVFISAATAWEITVKKAIGKLDSPDNLEEEIAYNYFEPLPITIHHAIAVGHLPFHHNDPFDRMLIAQTKVDDLTFLTADSVITKYDISIIWSKS